jgi:IS30 family transposase
MKDAGSSINSIASALRTTWPTAKAMIQYADTGEHPRWTRPGKRTGNRKGAVPKYMQIATDVARLKNREKKSFPAIVDWLARERKIQISEATARHAWDYAHQDEVRQAAEQGGKPKGRANYSRLGEEKKRQIRKLLDKGDKSAPQIAKEVGCGPSTIYRVATQNGAD